MIHPTQIFLSNPQGLRVEFRMDDSQLEIWWSPLAGQSTDSADRNYSSRDAHLTVFETIELPGCNLSTFQSSDYDPYHTVLRFEQQTLHLALRPDTAALLLWTEEPQSVDFSSNRFDKLQRATDSQFAIQRTDPRYSFDFVATLEPTKGKFRHCHLHEAGNRIFARAEMMPNQLLVIGVGLSGSNTLDRLAAIAAKRPAFHLSETNVMLLAHEESGTTESANYPELAQLRTQCIRILHSMIDESAAYRAAIKKIYYLIWIRDSGFSFAYQSAAGWSHKLPELCRLLLNNPLTVSDPDLPNGRMFGQLVNRTYGKREEDGIYYVVWALFVQWSESGDLDTITTTDWALIEEALEWVEKVTWDEQRGLYGEHYADETPTHGHRDFAWDYAIGKPIGQDDVISYEGEPVTRNYDVYFNTIMHSCYVMLAAMRNQASYLSKADRIWVELEKLLHLRNDGIPVYAEQSLRSGKQVVVPHWGQASSCCIWGLTMPNFAPLADWDSVLAATLDAIVEETEMHWINGICSAMTAVDTWTYPESKLITLHQRLAAETNRPGRFLPMGGAMPEKFAAPEGNLYHDIRPQGFAMGAWLAAWTSLGLRRLPYGLTVRPTQAFETIRNYPWKGKILDIFFGPTGHDVCLSIDGKSIPGTLQVPDRDISQSQSNRCAIRLVKSPAAEVLWLRSSVRLDSVDSNATRFSFTAFGLSSITFSGAPIRFELCDKRDNPIAYQLTSDNCLLTLHFTHFGEAILERAFLGN